MRMPPLPHSLAAALLLLAASALGCGDGGGQASIDAPRITSTPPAAATVGEEWLYQVVAVGVPEPTLTLDGLPAWLSREGRVISGTPQASDAGVVTFTITADNGLSPTAVQTVTLSVVDAGDDDGDGLSNAEEIALGTDPGDTDSDHDGLDDLLEVGPRPGPPTDTDGDSLPDALESRLTDNDNDGVNDQLDPTAGWQLTTGRFTPFAVASDGSEPTRLEVRITGGEAITRVRVTASTASNSPVGLGPPTAFRVDGLPVEATGIELFDDGTHGDRVPGDGLFTRDGISAIAPTPSNFGRIGEVALDEVTVEDATGKTTRAVWTGWEEQRSVFSSGTFALGLVAPAAIAPPRTLGPLRQATDHLLNLVEPLLLPELIVLLDGGEPDAAAMGRAVMAALERDVDFLYLFGEYPVLSGAGGATINVQNDVKGIGLDPWDNTEAYGSAGRLQSIIALNFGENGPLLHETTHRYGVFLDERFGLNGTHWGFSGADGQLGGFDPATLTDNGDGTWSVDSFGQFANGGDGVPYGPWELYLMGLLARDQVPTLPVLRNAVIVSSSGGRFTVSADGLEEFTVADIEAVHGARIPTPLTSPKAFTAAFVVISHALLTRAEMAFYEAWADRIGRETGDELLLSFEEATGGRATMDTRVP